MNVDRAREIALKILYDINEKGAYSNIAINKHFEANDLRDVDKSFITELVYGTVKWRLAIDRAISQFSSIRLKKISPWILNILRLGAYQLLYTDRIPVSAACNESVKLARRYGHAASSGFANAVLRKIAGSGGRFELPGKEDDPVGYLSIKYSHLDWMVKEWLDRFGAEFTESLLDSNNQVPDFIVRVNTLKTDRDSLIEALCSAGLEAGAGRYAPEAVIIRNPVSITKLEEFREGLFQVQDESSMLVAHVLDPQPGELVMDVCSAPGGKATHIAELMGNKGTVVARDIHEHKISIIEENAIRLGINIIKTELYDAGEVDETYAGKADRVLVDAPCTGFGIIRRKPDIKWARSTGDRKEIVRLQNKILYAASKNVKPGGTLVYSTCTIEPEENQEVVQAFLQENKEFRVVDITPFLPAGLKLPEAGTGLKKEEAEIGQKNTNKRNGAAANEQKDMPEKITASMAEGQGNAAGWLRSAAQGYIQLYPNVHGADGFFIARMERKQ